MTRLRTVHNPDLMVMKPVGNKRVQQAYCKGPGMLIYGPKADVLKSDIQDAFIWC